MSRLVLSYSLPPVGEFPCPRTNQSTNCHVCERTGWSTVKKVLQKRLLKYCQ